MDDFLEIPPERLEPDILLAVIEEYITREGTDYGLQEYSLEEKVEQIKAQLRAGKVYIAFDPVSESCTLLSRDV